jgi:hypothetical protein
MYFINKGKIILLLYININIILCFILNEKNLYYLFVVSLNKLKILILYRKIKNKKNENKYNLI